MGLDRLCFGTSTFVAGRLRPDKDSGPGMAALHAAIAAGIRLIHSNPKLLTQWAIRRVLDRTGHADGVQHLVKAEAPLDASSQMLAATVSRAVFLSRHRLGADRLHAVVLEIDAKRSQPSHLDDQPAVRAFYERGAQAAFATGRVEQAIAYCHRPAQVTAALGCPQLAGVAAQYHQAQPWAAAHLSAIADAGKAFIGMSPLARGALVDPGAPLDERLAPLRWAWADPRVNAVTVTMSSPAHFREVAAAVGHPQPGAGAPIDLGSARPAAR